MTRALLLLLFIVLLVPAGRAQESLPYRVIVNPENRARAVERKFLADVFLKKISRWPDGESVRPVDLVPDQPARRKFSQQVLGRAVSAVKGYWQQQIFSGQNVPPPELGADADVVEYVRTHRGAVGYVSPQADVSGVKVVSVD